MSDSCAGGEAGRSGDWPRRRRYLATRSLQSRRDAATACRSSNSSPSSPLWADTCRCRSRSRARPSTDCATAGTPPWSRRWSHACSRMAGMWRPKSRSIASASVDRSTSSGSTRQPGLSSSSRSSPSCPTSADRWPRSIARSDSPASSLKRDAGIRGPSRDFSSCRRRAPFVDASLHMRRRSPTHSRPGTSRSIGGSERRSGASRD
jgi:hypothetical protein